MKIRDYPVTRMSGADYPVFPLRRRDDPCTLAQQSARVLVDMGRIQPGDPNVDHLCACLAEILDDVPDMDPEDLGDPRLDKLATKLGELHDFVWFPTQHDAIPILTERGTAEAKVAAYMSGLTEALSALGKDTLEASEKRAFSKLSAGISSSDILSGNFDRLAFDAMMQPRTAAIQASESLSFAEMTALFRANQTASAPAP